MTVIQSREENTIDTNQFGHFFDKNFKAINLKRLFLRRLSIDDVEDMYEYTKNELSCRYLKWNPKSINETRTFIENTLEDYQNKKNFLWGIEQKQIKKLIGVIRMYSIDIDNSSAEISYIINPSFCRQGYATEAIKGIIQYAFQSMNLNRIQALCVVENAASKQAILNAGMSLEGILRSYVCIKGHYKDMYIYSIIKEPSIISTLL